MVALYAFVPPRRLTIYITAWRVDFLVTLPTFDNDLKAVQNLLNLALSSPYVEPPRFQFVSSVGVLRRKRIASRRNAPRLTSNRCCCGCTHT